jgi:hypothetical protein
MNWSLRSTFVSTTGGVMTDEVGAITGELELQTRTTPGGDIEAMVRYAGAQDLYTVSGSPVRAATLSERAGQAEHRATHERILESLTTPGSVESGNEKPVDLLED